MITTNNELHLLVDRFISFCTVNQADVFMQPCWFDLLFGIYQSQLFTSVQFSNLLAAAGLSRRIADLAAIRYSDSCELLDNYRQRIESASACS